MKKVERLFNGKLWKLSYSESNKSYYTMYPVKNPKKGERKTKRKWLGGDEVQAQIDFINFFDGLEGKEKTFISTEGEVYFPSMGSIDVRTQTYPKQRVMIPIEESLYFAWLRQKIMNKEFEYLAEGTGYADLTKLPQIMNQESIKLDEMYVNYVNSARYVKRDEKEEKNKTKAAWDLFIQLVGRTTVEQVTLSDVRKYESYLHKQGYADKTISHYKNRVSKIFRHNIKHYENTDTIQHALNHFAKFEELEINSVSSIDAQIIAVSDFEKLYGEACIEMKAVLMLCLNTGTYIKEVARFELADIDFDNHTLMTQRSKTGKCRKFAYLWGRTIESLQKYLRTRTDDSNHLFIASHGGAYKNGGGIRDKWDRLRASLKLQRVEFKYLRDTFETIAKEIGIAQYQIDMVMGHS